MLALLGLEIPDVKDQQMQMFTTGLKHVMDHVVKQAAPITPRLLLRMSKVVNYKDKIEVIAWTATLIGFYMFLRKSNLVPEAMDRFNSQQQFQWSDVNLMGMDKAMMIEVCWMKTLQFRQKVLRSPVLPADNKAICPVFWTYKMVQDNPGTPHDPLFLIKTPMVKLCLSDNQLIYRIHKWLKLVGEKEMEFSLHSLRRGGGNICLSSRLRVRNDKITRRMG